MKRTLLPVIAALVGAATTFAAPFTPGNLVIYRAGDGAAALTSAATPVFLDEYTTAGIFTGNSVPMPTAASGSNRQFTGSGTATSEGLLTRSADGQYLILAGYDAAVGTAAITTSNSTTVNRVIGRVASSSAIDTTTALTDVNAAASAGNPRGATSTNGTDLWMDGSVNGIRYATLGATTSTQLSTTVTNLRGANIFGGQLYTSAGTAAFRLGTVGTGTPTMTGETITSLPGFPVATGGNPLSPYQFFFADLDGVAGVDTVYVADDSSVANGGGIQKYSLVGVSWVASGIIPLASSRGLTGVVTGTNVALYVTANGTTLQTVTDTSGYNATINGTLTSLVTAPTNTAFRGVAFAPSSASPLSANSAVSRRTHGAAGNFDINLPLTGNPGIECRGGGSYTVILTFSNNVVSGNASVTGTGSVSGSPTFSANTMTINLTGVTDIQQITVTATNVTDTFAQLLPSVAVPMKVLIGDVIGNSTVNSTDVAATKAAVSAGTVNGSTFRADVNASGTLTATDVSTVKSKVPNMLP